ncbi:DNA polymerase III subunit delta' [Pseudohalioglobus lutimaris]|uniref:DNA-directed DNA polymerase n=1 Tax=Pseudohalioglobus lutimaris TaxID=1737061 RepID=A0A2N5X375_9GAMM|nr:DNA polymerase III subunit delta' [Pseudohalioglobus lutimaris]PLW68910.1 DNA polymerase III subunit delta' [Pseudohalioglobus lutimaris]
MMELSGLPAISAPLPWHASVWSRFNRQLQDATLPHALMLAGPSHCGKARLALALSRLLLCKAPSGGLNCGECHACELSASGSHGDWRWLQPEEKSRNIKIDQVRDAVGFATRTSSFGARKVMVLAPADAMNANAANALLKSLEEPSPGTFLLLVCDQLHSVPATIRSRCQIVRLPGPELAVSLEWLDKATGDREESARLLELAEGMPLLAEAMCGRSDAEQLIALRVACRGLVAGKLDVFEASGMLADAPAAEVLDQIAAAVRAVLRGASRAMLTSARGQALFGLLDAVTDVQRALRGGANPNRQLMTEVLLEKLHSILGDEGAGVSIESGSGR